MRHAFAAILICAIITLALRALPFLIMGGRETPAFVSYLGRVLPGAIMAMLVVYCLRNTSFASLPGFVPELCAGAVTVLLHIWKRNTLISIIGGTAVYMLLVQLAF